MTNYESVVALLGDNRKSASKLSGFYVYALWDGDDIIYIGRTSRLMARIHAHLKDKKFTHYSAIQCDDSKEMAEMESELIMRLKPKHNKDSKPGDCFVSISNLRRQIKDLHGDDLDGNITRKNLKEVIGRNGINIFRYGADYWIRRDSLHDAITCYIEGEADG